MLYLHAGWPRTSTTTFQHAIYENRDVLAAAGTVFPEAWLPRDEGWHGGLVRVLRDVDSAGASWREFEAFLRENASRDVLLSVEEVPRWLIEGGRKNVVGFLTAARKLTAVRCVWTLRRIDDLVRSLYLRRVGEGLVVPPVADQFTPGSGIDKLFAGMRRVDEALDGEVVYLQYDASGSHNLDLLTAVGIVGPARRRIEERLEAGPRRNSSLTHKQAAVLLNADSVARRAGTVLDREAMRKAFKNGEFSFEDDRRCDLVDGRIRQKLHERALEVAEGHGFAPYGAFFAATETAKPGSVRLDAEVLTDVDIERLVASFRHTADAVDSAA